MSKVEGGGVRLIPPISRLRVTIFSRRLLELDTRNLSKIISYSLRANVTFVH